MNKVKLCFIYAATSTTKELFIHNEEKSFYHYKQHAVAAEKTSCLIIFLQ
jgi:hypothetical protein